MRIASSLIGVLLSMFVLALGCEQQSQQEREEPEAKQPASPKSLTKKVRPGTATKNQEIFQAAEAASTHCKLAEGTNIDPDSLLASATRRHVLFLEPGAAVKRKSESIRKLFPSAYWLLDTQTGKLTNILDLLPVAEGDGKLLVKPRGLSANGRYALVLAERIKQSKAKAQRKKGYTAFLVTLARGSVEKIGEKVVHAAWIGNKISLSSLSRSGQEDDKKDTDDKKDKKEKGGHSTRKMMFFDPVTKSTTELEMRGIIISGHPDGTLIVFGCRLKKMTKAMNLLDLRDSKMAVINMKGKVLRKLKVKPLEGPAPSRPIFSDNGKYFAFRQGRLVRGRKPKKVKVRVIATTGDEEQTIKEIGTPIALTDDGRVIIVGNVFEAEGAPVKVWDRDLNSRTVLDHVAAATVVGNQLFYVTAGESALVKSTMLEF